MLPLELERIPVGPNTNYIGSVLIYTYMHYYFGIFNEVSVLVKENTVPTPK